MARNVVVTWATGVATLWAAFARLQATRQSEEMEPSEGAEPYPRELLIARLRASSRSIPYATCRCVTALSK